MKFTHYILLAILTISSTLPAASLDWGRNFYTDLTRKSIIDQFGITLINPTELNKLDTTFGISYTAKNHRLLNAEGTTSALIRNARELPDSNKDPINFDEYAISLSIGQNLGLLTSLSLSTAYSNSDLGDSISLSLSYAQWWRSETLQSTLSVGYLQTSQEPNVYPSGNDVSDFIFTKEKLTGFDVGLQLYHLTSPSFLWRGGASAIYRSDRPLAYTANLEGRYFVKKTKSSLHLKGNYFKNIDFESHADLLEDVSLISVLGALTAYSAAAELHQKLYNTVLAVGYRTYFETNLSQFTATATGEPTYDFKTGSDHIYASLRWRFAKDVPWTASQSPEVSIFGSMYNNNEPSSNVSDGANEAFNFGVSSSIYF